MFHPATLICAGQKCQRGIKGVRRGRYTSRGGLEETPPLTCCLSYHCIRCHRWAGTRPFPSTCNRGGTCSSSCPVCWCSSPAGRRCLSHSGTRCHLQRQKNASDFDKQGKMGLLVKRRGQEVNSQNLLCPNGRVWRNEKATLKYFALHCW